MSKKPPKFFEALGVLAQLVEAGFGYRHVRSAQEKRAPRRLRGTQESARV